MYLVAPHMSTAGSHQQGIRQATILACGTAGLLTEGPYPGGVPADDSRDPVRAAANELDTAPRVREVPALEHISKCSAVAMAAAPARSQWPRRCVAHRSLGRTATRCFLTLSPARWRLDSANGSGPAGSRKPSGPGSRDSMRLRSNPTT
jgi:hypothetical protein